MSKQARFSALLATIGLSSLATSGSAPTTPPAPAASDAPPEQEGANAETVPIDDAEKAVNAALDKGKADGRAEGFKAAQDRMVAVLGSDAGKKNPAAAVALLKGAPDMSADDAIATLDAMGSTVVMAEARLAPGGPAAIGADLNNTPKVDAGNQPNSGQPSDDGGADVWADVQKKKKAA